jgi:hypothetical protein
VIPAYRGTIVADGLARLTSQYAKQPGIVGMLRALLQQCQDLENALYPALVARQLRTATLYALPTTNVVLDVIGDLIGQKRLGISDADYQAILFLRAAAIRSSGRPPDWSRLATILLQYAASPAVYLEGDAALEFGVFNLTLPPAVVAQALTGAGAGGVRVNFSYTTWPLSQTMFLGDSYSALAGQGFADSYSSDFPFKLAASIQV